MPSKRSSEEQRVPVSHWAGPPTRRRLERGRVSGSVPEWTFGSSRGPLSTKGKETMADSDELRQAQTTLLDEAISHGHFGYHVHMGMKEGRVTSIVFATTDPEVI